jgi:transcriptional regulator with XRE-family HTH domain
VIVYRERSMRHVNIIGPVRRLRNQRAWSRSDLAIKLQRVGIEDATRSNVSKLEARFKRVIDENMLYLSRVLRVELIELYPEGFASLWIFMKPLSGVSRFSMRLNGDLAKRSMHWSDAES